MDDFIGLYVLVLIAAAIGFVLFWGTVVFLIVKFWKADTGLSTEEKLGCLALGAQAYTAGQAGPRGPGPVETEVRGMAAREGIDLD